MFRRHLQTCKDFVIMSPVTSGKELGRSVRSVSRRPPDDSGDGGLRRPPESYGVLHSGQRALSRGGLLVVSVIWWSPEVRGQGPRSPVAAASTRYRSLPLAASLRGPPHAQAATRHIRATGAAARPPWRLAAPRGARAGTSCTRGHAKTENAAQLDAATRRRALPLGGA